MLRTIFVKVVCVGLVALASFASRAYADLWLNVSELPQGSKMMLPRDYGLLLNSQQKVVLWASVEPQPIVLKALSKQGAFVQIFDERKKNYVNLRITPRGPLTYVLNFSEFVRIHVVKGEVLVNSDYMVKLAKY